MVAMTKYIDPLIASDYLDTKGLYIGHNEANGNRVYLSPDHLKRDHVLLSGPPGGGKTMTMTHFFSVLANDPDAVLIVIDPKPGAGFFTKCRDYALANRLTKRLQLFDLSELEQGELHLGYDPMRPNGIPPAIQAKQVREAIRSAHGQTSFDDTRQLARFLYYGLLTARLFELTLTDAVDIMWPGSALRGELLPYVTDPRLHAALDYVESLSMSRQDQLIASTLAMLESFVNDPYIQLMLNTRPCLDFQETLDNKRILLINLGAKNPLSWDDVRILGRLLINDLLSHVYSRKNKKTRVYLFIDECHLVLSHDLCRSLDLGRELGLTCFLAHQRLKQFEQEDPSGNMLDAVLTDCKVKMIFGGLTTRDLEVFEKETRLHEFDPYRIKNIMWMLEQEQVETVREQTSIQQSHQHSVTTPPVTETASHGTSDSFGQQESTGSNHTSTTTVTDGTGIRRGTGLSEAGSISESQSTTRTASRSVTESDSETDMWSDSVIDSSNWASALGAGASEAHSFDYNLGQGQGYILPTAFHRSHGRSRNTTDTRGGGSARGETTGGARSRARAVSEGESEAESEGRQVAYQLSRSQSEHEQTNHTDGKSDAKGTSQSRGTSHEHGTNRSIAVTRGLEPGESDTQGYAETTTIVPFYELKKRRVPSSIEFWSREEQALLNIQQMQPLIIGRFMLFIPGVARFIHAPWFEAVELSPKALARHLSRLNQQLPGQDQLALPGPSLTADQPIRRVTPELLLAPELTIDVPSEDELFQ